MVLYGVVGAAGKKLGNLGPLVAEPFLGLIDCTFIIGRPPVVENVIDMKLIG